MKMLSKRALTLMALVLILLPPIKGAFMGLLYRLNVTRGDARLHTADRLD